MQQFHRQTIARILIVVLFFSALILQPSPYPKAQAATAPSPTGHDPKFYWSPQRQATWNQMRAENNPWWRIVQYYADRSLTCERRAGDIGQWATLAYQMTGDKKYADAAWTLINTRALQPSYQCTSSGPVTSYLDPNFVPEDGRNFTREAFIDFAWMYDWLYPALTGDQRKQFVDTLNRWSDWVLAKQTVNGIPWGTRLNDSDETTGHYFGLAMTSLTTPNENPRAQSLLSEQFPDTSQGKTVPVGGLDATAADRSSMRNAIKWFAGMAAGGEWIESSDYNVNTMRLLYMGADATRTATNQDHFPELSALAKQSVKDMIYHLTPDLKDSYQWGDVEHARTVRAESRMDTLAVLAAVTSNDPDVGPYAQGLINDLAKQYNLGFTGSRPASNEPSPFFFVFYNPYAPSANWRSLPKNYQSLGQGLSYYNDLSAGGSLFGAHMPSGPQVDHSVSYLGDFQLYRNGEWVITHPIGYQTSLAKYVNAMLIGGVSGVYESKGLVANESKNGEFSYTAGTNGGQYYAQPYYNPPPTFLHEWTRSLFYLPGNGGDDVVIVYDRTNADDPKSLPSIDRYYEPTQSDIKNTAENKQWIIHTPVVPTQNGNTTSWQTSKGQHVSVNSLLPTAINRNVLDEKSIFDGYSPVADEKKYQVRISPQTTHQWDTFLNVVSASSDVTQPNSTLITNQAGDTEGTLIQRPGTDDALILFSAKQSPKLPSQPYGDKLDQLKKNRLHTTSFTVTATTGQTTKLYITDLDTSKTWSLIDNGTSVPVTVSDQGLGQATLSGSGNHTLVITPDGAPPIEVTPTPTTPGKANIELTLSADKTIVKKGDTITYTLQYSNTATIAATNVLLTQTIPAGTGLIGSSINAPACFNAATNTIRWPLNRIDANSSGTVTYQVVVGQTDKPADTCNLGGAL